MLNSSLRYVRKIKDVGQFFFYVLEFFCGEIAGLLGCLPKEVFKQFPCFDGEGFGEILGIVELRPVALVPECDDLLLDGY